MKIWLLVAAIAAWTPALGQGTAPVGFVLHRGARLPDAAFVDASGASTHMNAYSGKPYVLVFAYYTCPQLCGLVLSGMTDALRAIPASVGADFNVVVVSIDPGDGPAQAAAEKRRYVDRYARAGTGGGWHFLTGDQASIRALADAAGFEYVYDPIQRRFAHPAGLIVVDGGKVADYLEGVTFQPAALAAAIRGDARSSRDDLPARFRLLCGALDQALGRYTGSVLGTLRASIVAFLLLALAGGGWLIARRRSETRDSAQ